MSSRSLHVLVVDDEPAIRQVLVASVKKAGYVAESAKDGRTALELLGKGEIDVAICDINMPDISGIEVIQQARKQGIDTVFLMMTAFASMDTAIQAMRAGAFDYLTKPLRKEDVIHRLEQVGTMIGLKDENRRLRNMVDGGTRGEVRFGSRAMVAVDRLVSKVAPTDHTVLITGESGTGKGVLARRIHQSSPRHEAMFIPVNCGSIPENLLESEFFGHVKGAFTGADKVKKGLFVEADKGTLFLDEIGELPLHLQVKLLHVLEEKQVRPVGGDHFRKVDVRIVTATNRDLRDMVATGRFREDLFFRINVFNIHLPPLRELREDIPQLIRFFMERFARAEFRDSAAGVEPEAESLLAAYHWPGNVRELEHTIERALILADGGTVAVDDLPTHLIPVRTGKAAPGSSGGAVSEGTLRELVRNFELKVINDAIDQAGGDRKEAARRLGIGLSSLYRKLEVAGGEMAESA